MKKPYPLDNEDLREIRQNTDWRGLFTAFGIRKDEQRSKEGDWWGLSPFTNEKTPSFHMSEKGFYDFSSRESGGVIELTQKILTQRLGRIVNCYEAGKWLVDHD